MATFRLSSQNPGNIIRYAFGIEAFWNIVTGSAAVFFPDWSLEQFVVSDRMITPTSTILVQATGTVLYSLAIPLLMCIPNTKSAVGSRRLVYYTLGAGEALLLPLIWWKAFARDDTGMRRSTLIQFGWNIIPLLGWRIFTLFWRPQWFGLSEEEDDSEKR